MLVEPQLEQANEQIIKSIDAYFEVKEKLLNRDPYIRILRGIIKQQQKDFKNEINPALKTKLAQNIGYLIQVQTSLINSEIHLQQSIKYLLKLIDDPQLRFRFLQNIRKEYNL